MSRTPEQRDRDRKNFVGPHSGVLLPTAAGNDPEMDNPERPDILLTTTDAARLARLVDESVHKRSGPNAFLGRELGRAHVVSPMKVPANVVTMRSQIRFRYDNIPQTHDVTLLYPADDGRYKRKLSILTEIGTALLGLSEGQTMSFRDSSGAMHRILVTKVVFQPEAHGMHWL